MKGSPPFSSYLLKYVHVQNPDEPDKKPTLQSYQLDLNQTGPMVSEGSSLSHSLCQN